MIGNDWEDGELGGKREQDEVAQRGQDPLDSVRGKAQPCKKAAGQLCEGLGVQDQAEGGEEGKLEAHIPKDERRKGSHEQRHEGKRVQPHIAPPQLSSNEGHAAHEGRAHDSWAGPDEQGIE